MSFLKKKAVAFFFVIMFTLLLGFVTASAAGNMVLEVGSVEKDLIPGAEVRVPVNATTNSGYIIGTLDLSWNSDALQLTDIVYNQEKAPKYQSAAINDPAGTYRISFGDPSSQNDFDGTGEFFTLVYKVKDSAHAGEYAISIQKTDAGIFNNNLEVVNPSSTPGKVILKEPAAATYTVKANTPTNGKVELSKTSAAEGESIELTVTPSDSRYVVDKVTYTPKGGTAVTLSAPYTFTMPAADVTVNVTFKAADGAKFKVSVADSENGTATVNPTSATPGKTVTITPKPDDGYEVDSVKVKDNNGKTVSVKEKDDGTYTFVLPEGDVSVEITYKATSHGIIFEEPKHGKVTVAPKEATIGEKVTITATPDEGYEVDTVTVKDADGKSVKVSINSDGTYSFKMPANGAKVFVTFKETNCPSKAFDDLNTNLWYHEGIDYAIANGLMKGVSAYKFDPYGELNRAMLVTILYRLEGEPRVSGDNPYSDVESGSWYDKAVNWADSKGIVKGYGNGEFGPTDDITREQMAAMMMRYADFKGFDTSKRTKLTSFSDADSVSSWALQNVQWAVAEGLIKGSGGKLAPLDPTNRAEAATILMRFIENTK